MYILRRWWDRLGLKILLGGAVVGVAWLVQQTQGALLFEVYQSLARPFMSQPTKEEQLQNAFTQEMEGKLLELESQNRQLKKLLGQPTLYLGKSNHAAVIGRGADHWWQQITLGKGKQAGIERGFMVSAPGGLVGRVTSVTAHTSRVLLISDPSSRVGVTISRSRYMGYMRGLSADRAVMEFYDKVPDVQIGDLVATSPFSKLFPPGIPVGRVEAVNLNKSPAPEAVIEFSAPINRLEWVTVSPHKSLVPEDIP